MKNIKNIIEQKYPPENPNDLWMKDDVLYKSTHKGWTPLTAGGGSSTNGVTSTTWLELKDKRDAGKLTPGALYRITDYNCTTLQLDTRSAGHQFDIVLLALSENKLAEEGWAMMHESNIYDVTFSDGVTKKCYLYDTYDDYCNLVLVDNLLGCSEIDKQGQLVIDNNNKTIVTENYSFSDLNEENLTYNYFQYSNLSAWKVWYCLDNDADRFAWADDSVDESTEENIVTNDVIYFRDKDKDEPASTAFPPHPALYAWTSEENNTVCTKNEIPNVDESLYSTNGMAQANKVSSYTPAHEGTGLPNGRGVIYRLIDEWNNDVCYDFKNIQFIRPLTDGLYDPEGEDTWVYTIFRYNYDNSTIEDASISSLLDRALVRNKIDAVLDSLWGEAYTMLPNNVITRSIDVKCSGSSNNTLICEGAEINQCMNIVAENGYSIYLMCSDTTFDLDDPAIYINNKKVLTEE